ncbi:MAG: radical SAM protein [Oscillospiraceae bacterium]
MEYIPAKTIVTRNKSTSWFGAQYNMNVYRGCCHGCIYCDSRSACYRIEDFGRVRAKQDALRIIRDDLRRKVKKGIVATGSMSDPYNPYEKKLEITRHALELVSAYGFGAAIATKSPLIARDADVLKEIARFAPVLAKFTITAADDVLSRKIEPGAAPASERFAAMEQLSKEGIYTGVLLMPVLPWITDSAENLSAILHRAKDAGARFVYCSFGLTMREGQREYFYAGLDKEFPGMSARYAARYRDQYSCAIPEAKARWGEVREICDRLGLLYKMPEIIRSSQMGYEGTQLTFADSL